MPNHITNKLIISRKEGVSYQKVNECFNFIANPLKDLSIDFEKIKPVPFLIKQTQEFGGLQKAISLIDAYDNGTISEEDREFMNTILPNGNVYPQNSYYTLAVASRSCYKIYGFYTWYDWCKSNWGTKWNAYWTSNRNFRVDEGGKWKEEYIKFTTAWTTPKNIILALSEHFPDLIFTVQYADEDRGHNYGEYEIDNGEVVQETKFSGNEREDILIELLDCE